jgi:hypothetical protein
MHLGYHFRREEESDGEVRDESSVLETPVSLEGFRGIETDGDEGGESTETEGSAGPFLK